MEPLTQRQQDAFDYLKKHISEFDSSPGYPKMGRELGISTSYAFSLCRVLEKKGYISLGKEVGDRNRISII